MVWVAGVVLHDAYVFTAKAVTPEVIFEYNFFLKHHHQLSGFFVSSKKIVLVVKLIYTFPTATSVWFHVSGPADMFKYFFPAQGEFQVVKRQFVGIGRAI